MQRARTHLHQLNLSDDTPWPVVVRIYAVLFLIFYPVFVAIPRDFAFLSWGTAVGIAFGSLSYLTARRGAWRTPSGLSVILFFAFLFVWLLYVIARAFSFPVLPDWFLRGVYTGITTTAIVAVAFYPWTVRPRAPGDAA